MYNITKCFVPKHMSFTHYIAKIKKIKDYSIKDLPDRTKIFLSALWFWVFIAYYFNKLFGCMLGFVLNYTPDSCVVFHPKLLTEKKDTPKILDARLGEEEITNKLKMLVNAKWDSEIPELGGVNVKDLVSNYPALSTSVIWISYLFEMDKKLKNMSDEEIGKSIRCMLINVSDKVIYREPSLETEEDILFGEIPF